MSEFNSNLTGLITTKLDLISVKDGDVLHALKNEDNGYLGFGEAYFSTIKFNKIKAWKRHKKMNMNLIVPVGKIRFVVFDDREGSLTKDKFQEFVLSRDNYYRLTVPPMLWFGFQGLSINESLVLNISNIKHDPNEVDRSDINKIQYNWG